MSTARSASQKYPAFIAAENRKYFPTKPAVGGIPASERRKTSMAAASQGFFFARPLKSSTLSPAYPFASSRITRPKAPRFMKAYARR